VTERSRIRRSIMAVAFCLCIMGGAASAQLQPWQLWVDPQTGSRCDVINAANAELVVLLDDFRLTIVSGPDLILEGTIVDSQGFVYFLDQPAGIIDFATDGDGFRTLWWMTLNGRVMEVDELSGGPTPTLEFPTDFTDVPCDACPFWDDPAICPDDSPVRICGLGVPLAGTLTLAGLLGARVRRGRSA
jgi:hypothetical protein